MNPIAIGPAVLGLVMIGLSLPLVKGKIKRNGLYGVRIREAFESEERWLEINRYGGELMIWLGIDLLILAALGLTVPEEYQIYYLLAVLAFLLGGLGTVTALTVRYARKTKRLSQKQMV